MQDKPHVVAIQKQIILSLGKTVPNSESIIYIVATPIGNLDDLSPRAKATLQQVDIIWAEDTRHSRKLLNQFAIDTPTKALHEHNERQMAVEICQRVKQGESCAIISDAGTPLISDPGFVVVREAHRQGIKVVPIPGPSALVSALCASGLPSDRFVFEGFIPVKTKARLDKLTQLKTEPGTVIYYESPRRLIDTLEDMLTIVGGERQVVLARELSKIFETIKLAPLGELLEWIKQDPNQVKGEVVLLVEGAPKIEEDKISIDVTLLLSTLAEELPSKQAAGLAAKLTGRKKNELYDLLLQLKK